MSEPLYSLRGANLEAYRSKAREQVLAGPSDTGKTITYCLKVHHICMKYPGAQGAIVRKVYSSMRGSVLQTFNRIIAGRGIELLGGDISPWLYIYPNGSRVWVGGMDKPEKVLSSERDFVYYNQAEQGTVDDWEILMTRTSGRAAVIPHTQLFGDANPAGSKHFIRQRATAGNLQLFNSKHQDNPTIYNEDGTFVSEKAKQRIADLEALSGIRRKRLFEGIWATAEGAVYEMFDATSPLFVCQRDPAEMRRWFLALDEGFTNPWVILLIGEDGDGRWHVFKEFYKPKVLQNAVVDQAKEWFTKYRCEKAVCDNSAPGFIAALNAVGVYTVGGKGDVDGGIHNIQDRLKVLADGRTRLTVDPSCVNMINEFESYEFEKDRNGNPTDKPKKEHDHAMDAIRYLDHVMTTPTGAFPSTSDGKTITTGGGNPVINPRQFTPRSYTPRFR